MGTPDITGSYGEFSFYTSKLFAFAGEDIAGGDVHEVDVFDGVVDARLYGPDNPFLRESEKLASEFTVYLDPAEPVVKIVAGAEEVILKEGEFSEWVPVRVRDAALVRRTGADAADAPRDGALLPALGPP